MDKEEKEMLEKSMKTIYSIIAQLKMLALKKGGGDFYQDYKKSLCSLAVTVMGECAQGLSRAHFEELVEDQKKFVYKQLEKRGYKFVGEEDG